jgi:NAD(P)H-dependent flavin oxidoreductase YrpB (nitropropane dioxygenase family)
MARNNFLEQIQQAREAAEKPSEATEQEQTKPVEEMSDEELEQAERAARRKLLDLQHQELRDREIARVSPGESSPEASLADRLQELQRGKRRTWR